MRLNILWNKKSWRRIVSYICCICLFLVICCTLAQAAEPQVLIETGAMTYTDTGFAVDVTVKFEDMSLYNDQVYLSYHIVDENGGELLFENQRVPVDLEAEFMTMHVDCANLEELADRETAIIQFDLVDQRNVYWFSANSNISFQAASVVFDRGLLQAPTPSVSTTFSIVLNGLACVAAVILFFIIKRHMTGHGMKGQDMA